jgi:hypothetical protein
MTTLKILNELYPKLKPKFNPLPLIIGVMASLLLMLLIIPARAQIAPAPAPAYTVNQIADAIYLAEGGARTAHPYGILAHYKHTSARQACINTINHALKDFKGGDFIRFLQKRYCPVGAANDPRGLNKNWYSNVMKFLERG